MGSYAGYPNNAQGGEFDPTATGRRNVGDVSASRCRWFRVGNLVVVMGDVTLRPVLAVDTPTEFEITLPIRADFQQAAELSGTFQDGVIGASGRVRAIAGSRNASFLLPARHVTPQVYGYQLAYTIRPQFVPTETLPPPEQLQLR